MDNIIGPNSDNLADDFALSYKDLALEDLGAEGLNEAQRQAFANILFGAFVNGVITTITPNSNFNTKFNIPEGWEPQTIEETARETRAVLRTADGDVELTPEEAKQYKPIERHEYHEDEETPNATQCKI